MLRRINKIVWELLAEIFIYGLIIEFVGVWFVEDKFLYSTGLWIGIVVAMSMAIHMAYVIEVALDIGSMGAQKKMIIHSIIRYFLIVVIFIGIMYFKWGNIITCFIGIMGLKVAAYLQPQFHKFIVKFKKG